MNEVSQGNALVLTPDAHVEVRGDSPLLRRIFDNFVRSRGELLRLVRDAKDILPVAAEMRELVNRDPQTRFRVVFPPGALEKIKNKTWHLKEAKDGSGLLPTIFDNRSKFTKQVRLEKVAERGVDLAGVSNAVAHAQTHALLREVLAKLDVIDQKLDLQLAYQRAGWRGKIAAGVEQYRAVAEEPGNAGMRDATLANALQSVSEGQREGMIQLRETIKRLPAPVEKWWRQFLPPGNPIIQSPSLAHAESLDGIEDDFNWLYGAARTKIAIHTEAGRPGQAAREMTLLAAEFADAAAAGKIRYRFARYSEHREDFWERSIPALLDVTGRESTALAIECSVDELLGDGTMDGDDDER